MRTIETKVYTYAELSDKAKARARDWWREASAGDTFHLDNVIEDAAECLKAMGFELPKPKGRNSGQAIYWSLGYCQGDGAAFDAVWRARDMNVAPLLADRPAEFTRDGTRETCETNVKLHALVARLVALRDLGADWANITASSRGMHIDVTEFDGDSDRVRTEFRDLCRDLAHWIYWRLRDENDYQSADEQVAENIEANEYEFTADGRRFP